MGGAQIYYEMHLCPVQLSEGHHQQRRLTLQQCTFPGIVEEVQSTPSRHHAIPPQVNGQVEVSNREVKSILKKIIHPDGKDWAHKLPDALCAYQTTYKTPIEMSPFRLIFGKASHLSVELEHRAYWAIKKLNLSLNEAGKQRLLQLQELQELRHDAYENAAIYKEKTKAFHD